MAITLGPSKYKKRQESVDNVNKYFKNMTSLEIMQDMIKHLTKIKDVPNSKRKCKAILSRINIHIFDYVKGNYHKLKSKKALQKRCEDIGYYPLKKAKKNRLDGLLKVLT